jgi:hypothetical protein
MTPISLMWAKALGRRGKRSRPPRTMVSDVSASATCSVLKMVEENDLCGSVLCVRVQVLEVWSR